MKNRISELQITPIKIQDGLVALASLVLNDALYLSSIGIYTRPSGGYRLTYPTRGPQGINIFHPISKELGSQIENAVISQYKKLMTENSIKN